MSRINKSGIILSLGWLSVILLLSGCGESPGGTVPPVTEPEIIDLSIGVEEVVNLATTPEPRYFRVVANEGENLVITVDPKDEGHDYNLYIVKDFYDNTLDDTFRDDKEKLPNPDNFSSYHASAEHMGDEEEVVGITNAGGKYLITVTAENYNASDGEKYQYGIKVDYGKKYEVNVSRVAGDPWSGYDSIVEVTVTFVDADGQIDNSLNESPIEWYIEGGASSGIAKIKAPGEEYEYRIAAPARAPDETVADFIGKIWKGGNKVWVTFNDWLTIRSITKIGEHQRVVQVTLSEGDDDGLIEFAVVDMTKDDEDAKALRNRLFASGWFCRGEFYGSVLDDFKFEKDIKEKIRWGGEMPEPRLSPSYPVTLVKNQADLLYISAHGFSSEEEHGAITDEIQTEKHKFRPVKIDVKNFGAGDWDDDLEWVVLAACSVLDIAVKEEYLFTIKDFKGELKKYPNNPDNHDPSEELRKAFDSVPGATPGQYFLTEGYTSVRIKNQETNQETWVICDKWYKRKYIVIVTEKGSTLTVYKEGNTLDPKASNVGMDWAKVLAKSKIHALLGYRWGSLGVGWFLTPDDSVTIAQEFITNLNDTNCYLGYSGNEGGADKHVGIAWLRANIKHHRPDMDKFDPYNAVVMIKKEHIGNWSKPGDNPGRKDWNITKDRDLMPATELVYYWINMEGEIKSEIFKVVEPTPPPSPSK